MGLNKYNIPKSIDNKEDATRLVRDVFEAADDEMLSLVDWCKHAIIDERNIVSDLEKLLIKLLEDYYDGNVYNDSVEK